MTNSRQKGKRGELEVAHLLSDMLGLNVRRAQQYQGVNDDSADVIGVPGLSIEVKRRQAFNIYKALQQAMEGNGVPTVIHRKDRHQWLVTVQLADLLDFTRKVQDAKQV